ncbi:hypothetical protein MYU51_008547 [Penicillium brevicompactum]
MIPPSSPVDTAESVTVCESPRSIDSPENVDPKLDMSAILVRKVPYSLTSMNGCWTLSGPRVYYTRQDGETKFSFFSDLLGKDLEEAVAEIREDDLYFDKWASIVDSSHSLGNFMPPSAGVKLIVDIHGRDILNHYFEGCPWCGFAEEDKEFLDRFDSMEKNDKLPRHLVGDALDLMTDRFHLIEARHEEMGHWGHASAEERLERWKAVYLSDDNIVD